MLATKVGFLVGVSCCVRDSRFHSCILCRTDVVLTGTELTWEMIKRHLGIKASESLIDLSQKIVSFRMFKQWFVLKRDDARSFKLMEGLYVSLLVPQTWLIVLCPDKAAVCRYKII